MLTLYKPMVFATAFGFMFLQPIKSNADPANGKKIFEAMNCTSCHAPNEEKIGPSLRIIANVYESKKQMLAYFAGASPPIVEPERAKAMKVRRRQIAKRSEAEQQNLADYLLGFKTP